MSIQLSKWAGRPYVTIIGELDKTIFKVIDAVTSYKIKNFEHIDNTIYKCPKCGFWITVMKARSDYCKRCNTLCETGTWDGMIRLLSKTRQGKWYFPIGLISNVETALNAMGVQIEITNWPDRPNKNDSGLGLTWTGPTMRTHQDEAITKALSKLIKGRGVVLEMPTGSGKTMTAMKLMAELNTTTLILVHKKNLMEQWENVIRNVLEWEPALYGDNNKDIGPITIGMVQSIANAAAFPMNLFNFVITDECHHSPNDQTYKSLMKSDAYYKLGLSATPKREDGNELKMFAAIGGLVSVTSVKELIKNGTLAKPTIQFINAPTAFEGKNYAESYKNQITLNDSRNRLIAQKAYELQNKGMTVLITVNQIKHGKTLEQMIKGSKFVHGKTKKDEQHDAMEKLANGKLKIMISTLLGEGWDFQGLNAIILAGGGKSEVALIQKVGRVMRTSKDKKEALIVEIRDNGKWMREHSQLRTMKLVEMYGNN